MYQMYATPSDYAAYGCDIIPENQREKSLRLASRHIDALTFNRILGCGFDSLTAFQRELIVEAVCLQADFEYENADELESVLSAYSINGVSAKFGDSWNVLIQGGIATRRDIYELLKQTGLTCRTLRGCFR